MFNDYRNRPLDHWDGSDSFAEEVEIELCEYCADAPKAENDYLCESCRDNASQRTMEAVAARFYGSDEPQTDKEFCQ